MTQREYREAGFYIHTFTNDAARARYLEGLAVSGVEFETHAFEEVFEGTDITLYLLASKRISPTLKQVLTRPHFPKGD